MLRIYILQLHDPAFPSPCCINCRQISAVDIYTLDCVSSGWTFPHYHHFMSHYQGGPSWFWNKDYGDKYVVLYSGSKCYLLAKLKLSRNSTKFCGHLSTCEESLYSESERPWWSGTFQAVRNVKLRNLPCKSPRFLTFFQRLGCHGPGRHFRAKFEKADLA